MKFKIQVLALGLCLWGATAQAQEARRVIVTEDVNICESEKLKAIVEAVQCVANNCPDPTGEKKKLYEDRCTMRSGLQTSDGIRRIREREGLPTLENNNVSEINRVIVAEEAPTEEPKLLSPCECLAKLKERFAECDIEVCKPEEPKQPEQPKTPDTPKEVTPDTPKEQTGPKQFMFEGSGCSLNAATGLSAFGGWALVLAIPAVWAARRKKK
ncbi:MAG: hypothetical protein IT573_02900 [Deltaproteobacteria bacterium]|nr:hypothetical protein [Deltaproteobacteria bacterium]